MVKATANLGLHCTPVLMLVGHIAAAFSNNGLKSVLTLAVTT